MGERAGAAFPDFDFDALRRAPGVEAPNLFAVDASDRLILDEAASCVAAHPDAVAVFGDRFGALTLGAAARFGCRDILVFQDDLVGEQALRRNADRWRMGDTFRRLEPARDVGDLQNTAGPVTGARTVLMQAPRSLTELDEWCAQIARHAHPDVQVFIGGRIKHLSLTMNEVISRHFGSLQVSRARQKSRVLRASAPTRSGVTAPSRHFHADHSLWVCAYPGAFAGTSIDIGTRALLEVLDQTPAYDTAIDLGCGTGVLATALARHRPVARIIASDQSWAAVRSAEATLRANGVTGQVVRDIGLASQPDASADLIVLNPPFHVGATITADLAAPLFRDAARVLRPGGELWTVWNSHLHYRADLERAVGPTREIARTPKFTVTASRR